MVTLIGKVTQLLQPEVCADPDDSAIYVVRIEYLREFITIAETGSFTKAARRLYSSQPALSKHVKALEREVGAKLVESSARLTLIGRAFLADARKVVGQWNRTLARLEGLKGQKPLTLVVKSFPNYKVIDDQLRRVKRALEAEYPLLDFQIAPTRDNYMPYRELDEKLADVCIAALYPHKDMAGYDSAELLRSPLVAIVHASHPLAKRDAVNCSDLKGEVVHLLDAESFRETSIYIRKLLKENGLSPRFVWHTWPTYDEAFSFDFNEGVYISAAEAVAAYSIASELGSYSVIPLIEDNMTIPGGCVWRHDSSNEACRLFVNKAREVFSSTDLSSYYA